MLQTCIKHAVVDDHHVPKMIHMHAQRVLCHHKKSSAKRDHHRRRPAIRNHQKHVTAKLLYLVAQRKLLHFFLQIMWIVDCAMFLVR